MKLKFRKLFIYFIGLIIITSVILTSLYIKQHFQNIHKKSISTALITDILQLYDADQLSLFPSELPGVFKKKVQIGIETRDALILFAPQIIESRFKVPSEASLKFGFGALEKSYQGRGDGFQLTVKIIAGAEEEIVYSRYIDPKKNIGDRRWFDTTLDLKSYAGQDICLCFELLGSYKNPCQLWWEPDNRDDCAVVSSPTISGQDNINPGEHFNVILISIDTLRADHLGCYGFKRSEISPYIDWVSKKGTLFTQVISQSPWTIPSHMSIFTGLIPSFHRVNEPYTKFGTFNTGEGSPYRILSDSIPTLPQFFKTQGYRTIAITSGGTMGGKLGFCKGFDLYREATLIESHSFIEQWLKENKSQPFFMFLHTMRVHAPYLGFEYLPEVLTTGQVQELKQYCASFLASPYMGISVIPFEKDRIVIAAERGILSKMDLFKPEITKLLYQGAILETDRYMGKLLNSLQSLDLMKNTIVVITSDHGEEFTDHDPANFYDAHGKTVYDEVVHVPLIFCIPGLDRTGKKISTQVRSIDIMPTLLNLCTIAYDQKDLQGVSLLPFFEGEGFKHDLEAISEATSEGPEMKAFRSHTHKYIESIELIDRVNDERILVADADKLERQELYDLEHDPGEKEDLFDNIEKQSISLSLKHKLDTIIHQAVDRLHKAREDRRLSIDEHMRQRLKALGYVE
ncbi:sulfatase [bacterium]|nr:sulfatase [bacterium]